VHEIVEVHQDGFAAHIYRKHEAFWQSIQVIGPDAMLRLESLGIELPLSELYVNVLPTPAGSTVAG
jgi:hypothetical protein